MLITASFIIAITWKQPRYPFVGEKSNKLLHIQTKEYYSALKWNELSSHGGILNTYYSFPTTNMNSVKGKTMDAVK